MIAALELDAERAVVRDAVAAGCGGGWAALAELAVAVLEAEVLALRVVELTQAGRSAVAEAAANKVFHTGLCQEIAARAFEWGGTESLVHGARVQQLWLQSLWETIGGGTSEVMRGVVARQAFGLGGRG